jgi:hypothetical protein
MQSFQKKRDWLPSPVFKIYAWSLYVERPSRQSLKLDAVGNAEGILIHLEVGIAATETSRNRI